MDVGELDLLQWLISPVYCQVNVNHPWCASEVFLTNCCLATANNVTSPLNIDSCGSVEDKEWGGQLPRGLI